MSEISTPFAHIHETDATKIPSCRHARHNLGIILIKVPDQKDDRSTGGITPPARRDQHRLARARTKPIKNLIHNCKHLLAFHISSRRVHRSKSSASCSFRPSPRARRRQRVPRTFKCKQKVQLLRHQCCCFSSSLKCTHVECCHKVWVPPRWWHFLAHISFLFLFLVSFSCFVFVLLRLFRSFLSVFEKQRKIT